MARYTYALKLITMLCILSFLLLASSIPIAKGFSVSIPQDYPNLKTALQMVPDNTVIYVNTKETLSSPIWVFGKKNITIIGGVINTSYFYNYQAIFYMINSDVRIEDMIVISRSYRKVYVFPNILTGFWSINSNLSLYNVSIDIIPAPGASFIGMGVRGSASKISIFNSGIVADWGLAMYDADYFSRRFIQGSFSVIGDNLSIMANSIGIFLGMAFTNNSADIRNFVIRVGTAYGISIYTGIAIDPRDIPIPGHNYVSLNNGSILGSPPTTLTGITGKLSRSFTFNMDNIYIWGVREGISLRVGNTPFGRSPPGWDIYLSISNSFIHSSGPAYKLIEDGLYSNVSLIVENTFIEPYYGYGIEAFQIYFNSGGGRFIRELDNLSIYFNNVSISKYQKGLSLYLSYISRKNIWIEYLDFRNRSGVALDVIMAGSLADLRPFSISSISSISDLRRYEDFYIAYSIIWNAYFNYKFLGIGYPTESIGIYESVYDEYTINYSGIELYSIWTLETLVLSSNLKLPVSNIYVEYIVGLFDYGYGYTNNFGIFRYRFNYYFNITAFMIKGYFVDNIYVRATTNPATADTWYVPYINDTYTMPYWYGRIILYIDTLSFMAVGFSHKTGTLVLLINGYRGAVYAYYSYTPDEINLFSNNREYTLPTNWFTKYDIKVNEYIEGGAYLIIYTDVFFEGEWQPMTLVVNLISRIVYSSGPIDLRAIIIK